MLAIAARQLGIPPFGGYAAEDLAALIQPRILAAIDFLAEQDRLPVLLSTILTLTGPPPPILPEMARAASIEHAFDSTRRR
jgi:hypothetical protein